MGYHEYVHGAYYGLKYQASQKRYLVMLSAFESEWGTEFDAQSSLTVVYVTSKLYYDRG